MPNNDDELGFSVVNWIILGIAIGGLLILNMVNPFIPPGGNSASTGEAAATVDACGDSICGNSENDYNCCQDCGCDVGWRCVNNFCNRLGPVCGDSICDKDEECDKCVPDCGKCEETKEVKCNDGIDNDSDSLIDCYDSDCGCIPDTETMCNNYRDDDNDNYVDCADTDCSDSPYC